ncbi:hypothetical protein HPP92_017240 [Vanilla planifolia]|uniref:Uncharacterized protein n=1 Tax=Vanilla planifolia TaxID=51239 RepID=A0A835QF14_VANPL|nr:hypothetical protein HPP92_017240 [Vanilla planifolia]
MEIRIGSPMVTKGTRKTNFNRSLKRTRVRSEDFIDLEDVQNRNSPSKTIPRLIFSCKESRGINPTYCAFK